jgi:hypothetical protein
MITRRDFLKVTGGSTIAWYVATQTGWIERAAAAIPGGTSIRPTFHASSRPC